MPARTSSLGQPRRASLSVALLSFYSTLRPDQPSPAAAGEQSAEGEEPRIEITEVRSAADGAPLTYSIDDQGATLRVNLREPVPAGNRPKL